MVRMFMTYEGNLRCKLTHEPSGDEVLTDAPVDNMGKGEAFSPTDFMAASLGSCMLTTMGIAAKKNGINMDGALANVEKEMITTPVRKIGKITVTITMPKGIDPAHRPLLQQAAEHCPVHKSLHPDVETPLKIVYPD